MLFFPVLALPHNGIQDSTEGKKHATADDPAAGEWFKRATAGFGPYAVSDFKPGQQVVPRPTRAIGEGRRPSAPLS